MAKFTVDTQLFNQLGEFLVGRDSTALVELIKNAYDADSRAVIVEGHNLNDPSSGTIIIQDNGIGMNKKEFENGFLRIAARTKTENSRRSPIFKRRYTGEKGIGRLALHKLAKHVEIKCYRWNGNKFDSLHLPADTSGLTASIDWDKIENLSSLDEIENSDAIQVSSTTDEHWDSGAGTRIKLTRLRSRWTEADISSFQDDVATLVPNEVLVKVIPESVTTDTSLFATPAYRDSKSKVSNTFNLELLGELKISDSLISSDIASANWVLEVDCDGQEQIIRYFIAPTKKTLEDYPHAKPVKFENALLGKEPRVSFQARIFQKDRTRWPKRYQGIRVYMEGFRVLPYGESTDDWLGLNIDYTNRGTGGFKSLGNVHDDIVESDPKESLVLQPNSAYFGALFLTQANAPELRMLINREGFLPHPIMNAIRDRVRVGLDMLVRLRYSTTSVERQNKEKKDSVRQADAVNQSDVREHPSAKIIKDDLQDSIQRIEKAKRAISTGDFETAAVELESVGKPMSDSMKHIGEIISDASMVLVLASVGTELYMFSHEINGMLEMSTVLARQIDNICEQASDMRQQDRNQLYKIRQTANDLRQGLERQAIYLVDVASVDARRRRSRQHIAGRFDAACRLFLGSATKKGITIENHIDKSLKSPPMFPAELVALFTNLLSNAIKFGSASGKIKAWAKKEEKRTLVRVENTGKRVEVKDSKKWFEPFRSTTTDIDARLGQGMGLGLTITRSLLDEYGAQVTFVEPSTEFDTAIEIVFQNT